LTHRPHLRYAVVTAALLLTWSTATQGQAPPIISRAAIIRAEDARGAGPDGITPILEGLNNPALRELAIRAIGRLERPQQIGNLIPYLQNPALAATTAEALAQAIQGVRADTSSATKRLLVDSVFRALRATPRRGVTPMAVAALARSIGRLPYDQPEQARAAEAAILALAPRNAGRWRDESRAMTGVAHGLYSLARARRQLGALSEPAVNWLYKADGFGLTVPEAAPVRRLAWLALTANATVDRMAIRGMISEDRDEQVRRLAVAALPNVDDSTFMRHELDRVRKDSHWLVRLEWIRVYRQRFAATDCRPLVEALSDPIHHVRLAAIDALGAPCPADDSVRVALQRIVEEGPAGATPRPATGVSWHAKAHALLSLARIDSANARELLRQNSKHPVWQMRMYVARGAAATRDTMLLTTLAYDSIGSVREVAIQGLSGTVGHVADLVFARALSSKDYHVVLAAARALRGAPVRDSVMPAILDAVDRLTKEHRQTSRDPRLELLARVRELGTPADAPRLTPLLKDVDEAIAVEAGRLITHLNGGEVQVASVRTDRPVNPPAGTTRVRVTMSPATGGGTFDILLDADLAPMTVARILELIRNTYYDGLTFHRVLANFVLQGGSPGMNEYVGDGPFLRDELSLVHHARGTLGISTRGRDTGDAQWFINMVDNYRLDHDYTVFATVVAGMDVVDRILEGDIMERVTIVGNR
jgi:cyclophilin family peptidyl-prolyl cis-trans isomerase/HEAT repeat protein